MRATDELRRMLDERGVKWIEWKGPDTTAWFDGSHAARADEYEGQLLVERIMTPEQAIAATLGNERLTFLEEKVKRQGDYIDKLTKEKNALFAQGCDAATRHAGQIDAMQRKLEAATLGRGTCHDVWDTELMGRGPFQCSECGDVSLEITPRFCPNCGRAVVDL